MIKIEVGKNEFFNFSFLFSYRVLQATTRGTWEPKKQNPFLVKGNVCRVRDRSRVWEELHGFWRKNGVERWMAKMKGNKCVFMCMSYITCNDRTNGKFLFVLKLFDFYFGGKCNIHFLTPLNSFTVKKMSRDFSQTRCAQKR